MTPLPVSQALTIVACPSHGDLLESQAGQRHRGMLLSVARSLWPRAMIRRFLPACGLFMLIEAQK